MNISISVNNNMNIQTNYEQNFKKPMVYMLFEASKKSEELCFW